MSSNFRLEQLRQIRNYLIIFVLTNPNFQQEKYIPELASDDLSSKIRSTIVQLYVCIGNFLKFSLI